MAVVLDSDEESELPGEGSWACAACTFLNDGDEDFCEMCEAERPQGPVGPYARAGLYTSGTTLGVDARFPSRDWEAQAGNSQF